jgi:pyridoxal phosphate enzyme (YggS family)
MTTIQERFNQVQQRIQSACATYQRNPSQLKLLAVSKTKPIEDVMEVAKLGQIAFGENYVQELVEKHAIRPDLEWHFIGPLQSNKTRQVAENATWMHSVDRIKIAKRLNDQRPNDLEPLNVLLQVNVNNESSKSGFSFEELGHAVHEISALPNLKVRGLMAIPEATKEFERQRKNFAKVREALEHLQEAFKELELDQLSMGMSGDLEAAIAENATIIRIGTDIFGARNVRAFT